MLLDEEDDPEVGRVRTAAVLHRVPIQPNTFFVESNQTGAGSARPAADRQGTTCNPPARHSPMGFRRPKTGDVVTCEE